MQHIKDTHPNADITVHLLIGKDYYGTDDCTFQKFVDFPARAGYKLKESYALLPTGFIKLPDLSEPLEEEELLQSWLFFGLVYTVVRDDKGPLLMYDELLTGDPASLNNRDITTERLNGALRRWQDFMEDQARTNKDAAKLHMMRVEFVLQLARSVVKANCAADGMDVKPGEFGVKDTGPLYLSLMILGETLASTKALILDRSPVLNISGWHREDADEGWGPSRIIYRKFHTDAWCPRTVNILRSQLKSNATLMLAAYLSYSGSEHKSAHADYISRASDEDKCTPDVCKFKSQKFKTKEYVTNAMQRDHDHSQCRMIGPDMQDIINILAERKQDVIPLLEIFANPQNDNRLEFKVKRFDCGSEVDLEVQPDYAAISHVWSDGWGNEDENKLWTCQLRFIYDMLGRGSVLANKTDGRRRKIGNAEHRLFWMDTLVIPVTSNQEVIDAVNNFNSRQPVDAESRLDAKVVKKKAIRQIYNVFKQAEFTIIVDNGLSYLTRNDNAPCQTAMRILASGWMKRLWTLQEAYVSRRLYVAFSYHGGNAQPMTDFRTLVEVDLNLKSGVTALTKRHLTESIMFAERVSNQRSRMETECNASQDMGTAREGYRLIVGAWKAARFRTTSNAAHETLALATLLNLDYTGTLIDEAGLTQSTQTDEELDILTRGFWDLFQKKYPRSIPSGFIFLPGEKLGIEGYGWAPRTFLDVFECGYPDPLPSPVGVFRGTELYKPRASEDPLGLRVQYPGFLLHCRNGTRIRDRILGPDNMQGLLDENILSFPVNASLLDWYEVRPADNIVELPSSIKEHRTQLAIILTRPDPKEKPREIGVLVEIYKSIQAEYDHRRVAFCCQIIRRVLINRQSSSSISPSKRRHGSGDQAQAQEPPLLQLLPNNLFAEGKDGEDDNLCIGEALDVDQEWVVDGFQPLRERELSDYEKGTSYPPEDEPNKVPSTETSVGVLNRSTRLQQMKSWIRGQLGYPTQSTRPAQPNPTTAPPTSLPRVSTTIPENQSSRTPSFQRRETAPAQVFAPPRRETTLGFWH